MFLRVFGTWGVPPSCVWNINTIPEWCHFFLLSFSTIKCRKCSVPSPWLYTSLPQSIISSELAGFSVQCANWFYGTQFQLFFLNISFQTDSMSWVRPRLIQPWITDFILSFFPSENVSRNWLFLPLSGPHWILMIICRSVPACIFLYSLGQKKEQGAKNLSATPRLMST